MDPSDGGIIYINKLIFGAHGVRLVHELPGTFYVSQAMHSLIVIVAFATFTAA